MKAIDYSELFKEKTVEQLTIEELIDWHIAGRLSLPPIQRSVVWSNEQVVNYYDSLLRGYPAGTMMVHCVSEKSSKGRNSDGKTFETRKGDFQLFDGQQRITAVLLGLGKGQMKGDRKIWIDFGTNPEKSPDLKFQLRMTSSGQPFGYKSDAPNQKFELSKRQIKWEEWRKKHGDNMSPRYAFENAKGSDLIDARCAISFDEVHDFLRKDGRDEVISMLTNRDGASAETVHEFVSALENALKSKVILQKMDSKIVVDQEEYIRFFGRLGQGGTRLSDDELTYSIIKHQYPEIYDRMEEIMGRGGRLAGEVDLVLGALRVAKTMVSWDNAKDWEVISRPTPEFVSQLKEKEKVESEFKGMIGLETKQSKLASALDSIRSTLAYNRNTHPEGLPEMLLARLPRELVDVLILFAVNRHTTERLHENDQAEPRAFVLYWLLFIADDRKAAWLAFEHFLDKNKTFTENNLIEEYEKNGTAYFLPRRSVLSKLRIKVGEQGSQLLPWAERFTAADFNDRPKPGDALRVLSTNSEKIKRALIWLQRDYIAGSFPHYNPMSERDEDLPIDLDHIVPYDIFGFHWSSCNSRLQPDAIDDNFRYGRFDVGNSLGNFRWLSASENRSRHEGPFAPLPTCGDLVRKPDEWNRIIPQDKNQQQWSKDDIATFQRLIDLRTLDLYEELLIRSGIESILPPITE